MIKKFYKIKTDGVFKAIFCKKENRDILKRLIEEAIDKEVEIISLDVPELIKKNIYVKNKTLDVLVKAEDKLINIEINSSMNNNLRKRNASYIFSKYSEVISIGESYINMPEVIQINLTSSESLPMVSKYTLYDKNNKTNYIDNLTIYEYNISKIKEVCYNKPSKYKIMSMLDCTLEELDNIKGDEIMDKIVKETKYLNEDSDFVKFMSEEDEDKFFINSWRTEGREEGLKEGITKGKEEGLALGVAQEKKEIVKTMLEKKYVLEEISDITGLSTEEINKIKNTN